MEKIVNKMQWIDIYRRTMPQNTYTIYSGFVLITRFVLVLCWSTASFVVWMLGECVWHETPISSWPLISFIKNSRVSYFFTNPHCILLLRQRAILLLHIFLLLLKWILSNISFALHVIKHKLSVLVVYTQRFCKDHTLLAPSSSHRNLLSWESEQEKLIPLGISIFSLVEWM